MKRLSSLFLVSLLSGATTLGAYKLFIEKDNNGNSIVTQAQSSNFRTVGMGAENVDFTAAAENAVHAVVHVKNVSVRTVYNPIMEYFYGSRGGQQQEQIGTGSGVIISEDGYIVTNNHVIKDATELEVTLNNNKVYKAKLIGTDSKMDIALLKIDADGKLPYSTFADSDQVKVGEWVLAVGNPYNLTSTVTAGIVSAKARNLDTRGIQSFIQTDAAVNPGNSGGALVNTRGELIGINTMISSPTGSYAGYSFAVPSNITRKIIEDIMEFGNVQRGILGVEGNALTGTMSKEFGVKDTEGFYINKVNKNSGAEKAGLKEGDIIKKLDNQKIGTFAELSGYINTKRPNDKINVTYVRDGNIKTVPVTLVKNDIILTEFKGLELENLSAADKKNFRIDYGVKIKEVNNERLEPYKEELQGSIILDINGVKATDVETVSRATNNADENQGTSVKLMTKNGQVMRIII
ncbi:trypsin-like peptidase domain-containing protein [Flavobacterium aquatile]|uniref:Serine protease n=1 Tax=Flavobacterium aquatile LMG 4008 = ATCC 11947 TaxID=1453498 RepID=A0A095V3W8_9FLAO|nr:trypsin-like peptidase domain-containing protein [Flavobacterium aquatile]KGD69555.1 serine protease [Flavobacterium aquatile LMG 4008 = ATCC 11947]OXA67311.1 serine protease [Flavobacterium aquatile] [Flavobacterium aquatile LMG 4008 = ATCC 11947]GEC77972.1 serine protease [Flavobacterium aquatile]